MDREIEEENKRTSPPPSCSLAIIFEVNFAKPLCLCVLCKQSYLPMRLHFNAWHHSTIEYDVGGDVPYSAVRTLSGSWVVFE